MVNDGGIAMKYSFPFSEKHPRVYRINNEKIGSDISVVEIGYNKVPGGRKQITTRNLYILHYVIGGRGIFCGETFDETKGYLVVPGALEIIQADREAPYETFWIMLQGEGVKRILAELGLPHRNCVFDFDKNRECASVLRQALFDIEPRNEREEAYLMHSLFYRVLSLHVRPTVKDSFSVDSIVYGIKNYIENNYHRQIIIADLARQSNYTRNYLYKLFRKEYGLSPQEYLMNLRIEKAKLLLGNPKNHFTIGNIAAAVGFSDPLYFSKLFRKKTGKSPNEYRKNA